MFFKRVLSFLSTRTIWRGQGRYGPLELNLQNGELVVDGPRSNQSHGSLHTVWRMALHDHLRPLPPEGHILVLGLGAGSSVQVLRQQHGLRAPITGVDGDPVMLDLGRKHFGLADHPDLRIVQADALEFLLGSDMRYDLVLVDLFHDLDMAPDIESPRFMDALRARTTNGGQLFMNAIDHDPISGARCLRLHSAIAARWGKVEEHRFDLLNRVFVAAGPFRG